MKTRFFLFSAIAVIMVSCFGGPAANVDGVKTIEGFNNYKDACSAARFDVAHRFLAQMEENEFNASKVDEAEEYIFRQELTYLVSMGDEQSINRIIFLFKQNDIDKSKLVEYCDDAIDLAISMGNDLMVDRLVIAYPDKDFTRTICDNIAAYYANNQVKFRDFLLQNLRSANVRSLAVTYCTENNDKDLFSKMMTVAPNMSTDEAALKLWAKFDYAGFEKQITTIIGDAAKQLPTMPATGMIKSDHYGELDGKYQEYIDGVKKYNNVVINVISILVEVGKRDVAASMVNKVKPNLNCTNLGDWCDVVEKSTDSSVYNAFQVTADNTEDIKTAKQLLL